MNEYFIAKWLHILSSTILFGTGIGSAFYMLVAGLSREPRLVWFVTRWVVIADWIFTTTAVILQPLTGFWLLHVMRIPWDTGWVKWSIALYLLAGACWLPVVWMQIRMRDLAREAMESSSALPSRYTTYFRCWVALGIPAFFSLVVVFYLMVAKPVLP